MSMEVAKAEEVKSLYLQGNNVNQISKITEIPYHVVKRIIVQARLQSFKAEDFKDKKTLLLGITQDQILEELAVRDFSGDDIQKLANTFKTMHTAQREEEGKSSSTVQVFFDLVTAANQNSQDIIDAEFEEMGEG